jgi:hypothetical protein
MSSAPKFEKRSSGANQAAEKLYAEARRGRYGMCFVSMGWNPVRKGLVDSPEKFPYGFTYLGRTKASRG